METTKNNLSPYISQFFHRLSKYLDKKLLFFGSVQRYDYFPGKSDIDVSIYTDNIPSTISKMQHFLKVSKSDFKRFIWKLNKTGELLHGYKIIYKEPENNFVSEFSIYDEKYKNDTLAEYNSKIILPFYASVLLIILKFLYYKLNLIPGKTYTYTKRKILSVLIGLPDDEFVVLDMKSKKKK